MAPRHHRVLEIIDEEAARAHIRSADIIGPSRAAVIVGARQSFNQVGWLFRRHHANVMRAIRGAGLSSKSQDRFS
jgi:chromosomal replication initiation ATPase DnaA